MELLELIKDLMRFKTITGNSAEIDKCLEYIKNYFSDTKANVSIERFDNASPVIFIRNNDEFQQDVLVLGHIDVVTAPDDMFQPYEKDGKLYGRGSLDMKSFAAVALNSMRYVLENNIDVKFAIVLSTDEETGSLSTESFFERYKNIDTKVVLDNDVGGDVTKIITKCKNPVYFKLIAEGKAAHGSTPWDGLDANEMLMRTIAKLRKFYPYYDIKTKAPQNTWIDTMHVSHIEGGKVMNIITSYSEALLSFRLIETSTPEEVQKNIESCLEEGVHVELVSTSTTVVMDEKNPLIVDYKNKAEAILNKKIDFEHMGGATDSRIFADKGSTVIMHSGTGEGMHAVGEYVVIDSVKDISRIQIEYLKGFNKK